jgi:hypothetical protein
MPKACLAELEVWRPRSGAGVRVPDERNAREGVIQCRRPKSGWGRRFRLTNRQRSHGHEARLPSRLGSSQRDRSGGRLCCSLTHLSGPRSWVRPLTDSAPALRSPCIRGEPRAPVASLSRCKFVGGLRFPGASLGGCDLLVERFAIELLVFDSVEVLAVELGERGAV